MKNVRIWGIDLALNHTGIVELDNGELSNFWYITTSAGAANRSKKQSFRLHLKKTKDRQFLAVHRLHDVERIIRMLLKKRKPHLVGMEDYSLGSARGAHYTGEMGGVIRLLLFRMGVRFRLHDPLSIKLFVCHDGSAQKDFVEYQVNERWGIDFSGYNPISKRKNSSEDRTTSEDLCDAFSVAQMIWTEYLLRTGQLLMSELHEQEVRVFNRVTKTYPVSLLDREWILKK